MNPMFAKLVEQKKAEGRPFDGAEKEANSNVLADLMHFLSGMEGDKLKGLKKVTVASNNPQGLEAGLSKAKDMVASHEDESPEDVSEEGGESPEEEMQEHEDEPEAEEVEHKLDEHAQHDEMTMDELKQQVEMLKSMLASKGM